jgi:hypothetical protein
MALSFVFLLVPTLCYAGAAVAYGIQRNYPLMIVYSGYAWANVGLMWLDRVLAK